MYDLLVVGAGITAATLVARLKPRLRICVMDCRPHLGGNCFDESSDGTLLHRYGPHIFHSPSPRIVTFLSGFTDWTLYRHSVLAEVEDAGRIRQIPFPYCRQTVDCLGRELSEQEIIDTFFRPYSEKMWGMPWDDLPLSIRGRVPKNTAERPLYHRDQFVALPKYGYTRMMENMLDGAKLLLGAPPTEWTRIGAKTVIFTGRPDLIPVPGELVSMGERHGLTLNFRTLDISFAAEAWTHDATCLHACHRRVPWTRRTCQSRLTGGASPLVSTEIPRQAAANELTPFYPVEIQQNRKRFSALSEKVRAAYPNLHLAGRLGSFRYLDMYQAVGQGLALAESLFVPD